MCIRDRAVICSLQQIPKVLARRISEGQPRPFSLQLDANVSQANFLCLVLCDYPSVLQPKVFQASAPISKLLVILRILELIPEFLQLSFPTGGNFCRP
eukprot:429983-Lingulodinium_polyedra.AAC.1